MRRTALSLLFLLAAARSALADSCVPYLTTWTRPAVIAMATDVAGNVYAISPQNVFVYDRGGVLLRSWSFGTFDNPRDIAVDSQGFVYIASYRGRILKFTGTGTFVRQWSAPGCLDQNNEWVEQILLAVDAANNVYATDNSACQIHKYTSEGALLQSFGSCGSGDGQFSHCGLSGVAVGSDGTVYASDANRQQVLKFSSDGSYLGLLGVPGSTFPSPTRIDTDPDGSIHVLNPGIWVTTVASEGTVLCTWGEFGTDYGQLFEDPDLAVAPGGIIYGSDFYTGRIQKFGNLPTAANRSTWGRLKVFYR